MLFAGAAQAADYYVDAGSSSCSISGPGTQLNPYCTISAAVGAHSGPGVVIWVKLGTYREQVTIPASGAAGNPFVIRSLGGTVVVDGADDFSNTAKWTLVSGNVWLASSVNWTPKQVFADGVRLAVSTVAPASLPTGSFKYVSGTGLYVNVGGTNPGLHQSAVGHRQNGFVVSGRSHVTIDGFTVTRTEERAFNITSSSNVTVAHNTVTFTGRFGIYFASGSGQLIESNVCSDNADHGIVFTQNVNNSTLRANECFRNSRPDVRSANGIYVYDSPSNLIERNRLHENQDSGLQINRSSANSVCIQNISWNNGDHGYDHLYATGTIHIGDIAYGNYKDGFSIEGPAPGTQLYDCIAINNGLTTNEFDLWVDSGSTSGFVSDYNIFWNSTSQKPIKYISTQYSTVAAYSAASGKDAHSTQVDPLFINPSAADFHLGSTSPAIDAGTSAPPNWPATDADGNSRVDVSTVSNTGAGPVPYTDRGAFEFRPSGLSPIAQLTVNPNNGRAPLAVTADASGSTDPNGGGIVSYRFDFGDSTIVGPQATATATHTFAPGTWTVTVTVVNTGGFSSSTSQQVLVNRPPVATLSLTPPSGPPPFSTTADASGSSDPEGGALSYRFDFGDGAVVGPQTMSTAAHTYPATGKFTVTVTVSDSVGDTGSATRDALADIAPDGVIDLPQSPSITLTVGQTEIFQGTGADSDGPLPLTYLWDFGGGAANVTAEDAGLVTFATPGVFTVRFIVTDALSLSDPTPDTRTITVQPDSTVGPDEIHWTFTGQNSVTFDWRGGSSTINYGLTSTYGQSATGVTPSPLPWSSAGPFREARLTGLQENTVYHYSIGVGPDHTFRTPPAHGGFGFTVCAEGDVGDGGTYTRMPQVQADIAAATPRFALVVGDLTYANNNGQASVDRHFNDVMVWSQDAAYMPAWGNHDWSAPDDLRNYKGRFDLPNPRTSPDAPAVSCCGEDWYWFDYGNVRFIAYPEPWSSLDWNEWAPHADTLMSEAQADPAIQFIVTFGHRDSYSSGHHQGESTLSTKLNALGVKYGKYVLDVAGHSHDYERSYPQSGVVHVIVGTGGNDLEEDPDGSGCLWSGGCPAPSWSAFRAFHHGSLKLFFGQFGIQGQFICGPAGNNGSNLNDVTCTRGSVLDEFTIGTVTDRAPVVTAPAQVSGQAVTLLTVNVSASDPDGDAIQSLTANLSSLPAGNNAVFTDSPDHTSGTFTWTPASGDTGSHSVTFTASNALSGSAFTTLVVTSNISNVPPVAVLAVTPGTGNAALAATANGSGSSDSDGSVATYRFDFGDGTIVGPQPAATATHTYAAGNWTVTLQVTDNSGATATATASVVVAAVGPGANLVGNPSFETGLTGWGSYSSGTLLRVPGGFDGVWSLQLTGPATTTNFGVNDSPNWVANAGSAGSTYRFGAWVRSATNTGTAKLQVREYVGGTKIGGNTYSTGVKVSPAWQLVTMDFTTGATGSTLDYQVIDYPLVTNEVFLTDNISIYKLGSTAASAELGGSLNWGTKAVPARVAFVTGNGKLNLATSVPTWSVRLEFPSSPTLVTGAGLPPDVVLESEFGDMQVRGSATLVGDLDGNGIPEVDAVFRVADLGALMAHVPAGSSQVPVHLGVFSLDGEAGEADLTLEVTASKAPLRAAIAPNPVRSGGALSFVTTLAGPVLVQFFDISGREVGRPMDEAAASAGLHQLRLGDGATPLLPGVYFYRIRTLEATAIGRFLFIR